jgi:hypothetical protein
MVAEPQAGEPKMSEPSERPLEGQHLHDGLKRLVLICALAESLSIGLEPLSEKDIAGGVRPLTPSQIQEQLARIVLVATKIALEDMRATPEEWYAANDAIE